VIEEQLFLDNIDANANTPYQSLASCEQIYANADQPSVLICGAGPTFNYFNSISHNFRYIFTQQRTLGPCLKAQPRTRQLFYAHIDPQPPLCNPESLSYVDRAFLIRSCHPSLFVPKFLYKTFVWDNLVHAKYARATCQQQLPALPSSGTVSLDCIHLAWYMGFKRYYLIGCDFEGDYFNCPQDQPKQPPQTIEEQQDQEQIARAFKQFRKYLTLLREQWHLEIYRYDKNTPEGGYPWREI
jgi:hypothetical protein